MEHIEIKTEESLYDEFDMSQNTVETTEDLFCGTYSRQSHVENQDYDHTYYSVKLKDEKHRATWLAKHCELLVSLYKEALPNLGKTWRLKTKRNLWEYIAEKLREEGLSVSYLQVEGKWKSLKRAYITAMMKKKNGQDIKFQPYEKEFSKMVLVSSQELFSNEHHPEDSEDSGRVKEQPMTETSLSVGSESPMLEMEYESLDAFEEHFTEQKEPPTIAEEIQKLREEFAKERQEKSRYRNAKLMAYKKRTAVLQKQLKFKRELLKAFLKSENKQKHS